MSGTALAVPIVFQGTTAGRAWSVSGPSFSCARWFLNQAAPGLRLSVRIMTDGQAFVFWQLKCFLNGSQETCAWTPSLAVCRWSSARKPLLLTTLRGTTGPPAPDPLPCDLYFFADALAAESRPLIAVHW